MQVEYLSKSQSNWYVVYTFPKSERKADSKLKQMGVTSLLPLHHVVRQWSDRKKKLEVPLFPNYIFVYTSKKDWFNILKVRELVQFVSFGGEPAIIPDDVIDSLKRILDTNTEITNEEFGEEGMKVKINCGQFAGMEGVLIRRNGRDRLVVQIEALKQAISIDILADQVEKC